MATILTLICAATSIQINGRRCLSTYIIECCRRISSLLQSINLSTTVIIQSAHMRSLFFAFDHKNLVKAITQRSIKEVLSCTTAILLQAKYLHRKTTYCSEQVLRFPRLHILAECLEHISFTIRNGPGEALHGTDCRQEDHLLGPHSGKRELR